jgi:Tol biopolymer transport system component
VSPAISADGRYVAFQSSATNLVSGDTNGVSDIFLRDRQAGITRRVSTTSSGTQGNRASYAPSISADGEHVAFASHATNLVAYDTNDKADVFVQWQHPAITGRVSLRSDRQEANGHSQSPAISADGRYVAFESSATNLDPKDEDLLWDVYTVDLQTRETDLASEASRKKSWYGWDTYFEGDKGNGSSRAPAISADGRSVAFESAATNLWNLWDPWEWSGDTNGVLDVSVQDRW